MSELKRLLDDDGDAFERELLSAAVDDPDEAKRAERLVVALGLDGPVGPGGGGHGGDGGAATQTTGAVAAKVAAGAAVAGVVIWGALALRSGPEPERPPAVAPSAPVVVAPTVSAVPVREPPPVASSAAAPAESAPKPVAPARPQASAPDQQKKPATTAVSNASQLAGEVRALDRVRSALRSGDAARAKSELSAYYAAFPNGILAPEARGLGQRIEKSTAAGHNP